MISSAAAAAIY